MSHGNFCFNWRGVWVNASIQRKNTQKYIYIIRFYPFNTIFSAFKYKILEYAKIIKCGKLEIQRPLPHHPPEKINECFVCGGGGGWYVMPLQILLSSNKLLFHE